MRSDERLLQAMNGIDEATVLETRHLLEGGDVPRAHRPKRLWRALLIAAVLMSLLSATAYAVTRFTMQGRPGAKGESFTTRVDTWTVEWPGEYVFTFEGPEECHPVRFKAAWAPSDDYWGFMGPEEDGFASLLEATEIFNEEFGVYMPACVVDVMYAPQFVDGGAMILAGFSPREITQERWGEVEAYKFEAMSTHAIDREQTTFLTGNYLILFHPVEGWIIGVRGYDSMETIERIARGIEVQSLDGLVRSGDFESNIQTCDIYIG